MQGDAYSRLVAGLKVLLPLAALIILSLLFLLSRSADPIATVPFADSEVQDRLRDQQVTGPFFSSTTEAGDQISFSAGKLTRPADRPNVSQVSDLSARMILSGGLQVALQADLGEYDIGRDLASLSGNSLMTTSSGYRINTDQLTARMTKLDVQAPGEIRAEGPFGSIEAGSMRLHAPERESATQLIFTNGVKLVYQPEKMEN